jgi:hypothetical protein
MHPNRVAELRNIVGLVPESHRPVVAKLLEEPLEEIESLRDTPPSLAAVRRLLRGFERYQEYIESLAWSGLSDENAEAMLARAWELGGDVDG